MAVVFGMHNLIFDGNPVQEQERRRKAEVAAHSALNGPRVRAFEYAGPDFQVRYTVVQSPPAPTLTYGMGWGCTLILEVARGSDVMIDVKLLLAYSLANQTSADLHAWQIR